MLSKLKDGIYCTEGLLLCVKVSASELLVLTEARLLRASTSSHTTTMHLPLAIIAHVGLRADGKAVQIWLKDGSRKPTHRGDGTVSGAAKRGLESAKRWISKHHLVRSSRPAQIASLSATALESEVPSPHPLVNSSYADPSGAQGQPTRLAEVVRHVSRARTRKPSLESHFRTRHAEQRRSSEEDADDADEHDEDHEGERASCTSDAAT